MSSSELQKQWASSFLSDGNMGYVDELYEDYLIDPSKVPTEWQTFFQSLPKREGQVADLSHRSVLEHFRALGERGTQGIQVQLSVDRKAAIASLIHTYRSAGHWIAKLDPLEMNSPEPMQRLDLAAFGLDDVNPQERFTTCGYLSTSPMTLAEIEAGLKQTYCSHMGLEFTHLPNQQEVNWFAQKMESTRGRGHIDTAKKLDIFKDLVAADGLERYLGTRFVGQKRFSLEGGDALIPMMKTMLNEAAEQGVREVVIGMAHRGRLNMLVNVLGKSPKSLFDEFEGKIQTDRTGDVKYHMGFSSDIKTPSGEILHLALAFNPSHLEIIGPVVEGSVRSRLNRQNDVQAKNKVMPIVIHGDAAFIGQGVVMEMLNFSQVPGFCTGGTVHLVINNQIGFTTSDPHEARSTRYCTDIAKMVDAPVIHVNGNDPEAAVFAIQLAYEFRMRFKRDVVVDLVCYRRHGHNEGDEPAMTQPTMYQKIKTMPTLPESYAKTLIKQGLLEEGATKAAFEQYRDKLDAGICLVEMEPGDYVGKIANDWTPYLNTKWTDEAKTAISLKEVRALTASLQALPEGFTLHPVIARVMAERQKMAEGSLPINWGYAETLAYASLLHEGYAIRLSGEDAERGTFAHRHAVLNDFVTGERYIPLNKTVKNPNRLFTVINNPLSEEAVLAFEYGYACSDPSSLVLWEAQFGDFVNGAQVVIDQFISSGEQKWGRLCGLVLLLPHGYEGQGPEHSSARLERFMQLCAQHNMQVCAPTTPAQIFHLLRRQMVRPFRKPLIVMTPKSLLRHKLAVSTLNEFTEGGFQNVIPESDELNAQEVKRVIVCSGKVYFDLLQKRREVAATSVAIIRVEQLYPFPEELFTRTLNTYPKAKEIIWCQEEPENQGAWFASQHHIRHCMKPDQTLSYAGRPFAAAPAAGSAILHVREQESLVNQALGL